MPQFLSVLFILFTTLSYSQTIELSIQNDQNKAVKWYSIYINDVLLEKNIYQTIFHFQVVKEEKIEIKHPRYVDYQLPIPNNLSKDDTLRKLVQLPARLQEFEEVTILGQKFTEAYNERNEFIEDYYLLPQNKVVVLVRYKGENYLQIINERNEKIEILKLDFRANSIFLDPLNNFFLLNKKEAVQFNIVNDQIILNKTIENQEFDEKLKNLIVASNNYAIYDVFSLHNQKYSLIKIKEGKPKSIFEYFNFNKFKNASYHYNKTVALYNTIIHENDNIIKMGIWDGDLMTLNSNLNPDAEKIQLDENSSIIEMTSWSDKIASKPLNLSSYSLLDELIILNGEVDSIIKIDYNSLKIIKETSTKRSLTGNYFHDYYYNNIYMIEDVKGTKQVYKIDIETGELELIADLSDIHHPRNIKIINDEVYLLFLDKSGFNSLLKFNP